MSWVDEVDWSGHQARKRDAVERTNAELSDFARQQAPLFARAVEEFRQLHRAFEQSGRATTTWHGPKPFGLPRIVGWLVSTREVIAVKTGGFVIREVHGDPGLDAQQRGWGRTHMTAHRVTPVSVEEVVKITMGLEKWPIPPNPGECSYLEDWDGDIVHLYRGDRYDDKEFLYDQSVRKTLIGIVRDTVYTGGYTHGGKHAPGRFLDVGLQL
ncbi:MAG: hypothetical protein QM628_15480 [Propionicimonas sp.]